MPPTTQTAPEGPAVSPAPAVDLQSPAGGEQRDAFKETKALLDQADAPAPPLSNVPEGSLAPQDPTAPPTDFGLKEPVSVPVRPIDAGGGFPLPGDTLPTTPAAPVAPVAPVPPQPLADAAYPQQSDQRYPAINDAELTRAAHAAPPEYAALAPDKLDAEAATPEGRQSVEALAEDPAALGAAFAEIMKDPDTASRNQRLGRIRSALQKFIDTIPAR